MTARLRVGIVVPGWSGPGEEAVLPALQALLWQLAADHDLRVVALRHPPIGHGYTDRGGVTVLPLGHGRWGGPLGRGAVLGSGVRALLRLHQAEPFDALHAFWADEPALVAVTAGRLLGRRVAVSVMGGELAAHADIGYGAALGMGGRLTVAGGLRGADVVTVGSSWLFATVAARFPDIPILRLPLGVDLGRFTPADGRVVGPPRVLFVGSLQTVKDPVLLLRAFARVRTPGAELVIVGDGPLRPGLERLAAVLGIEARTRFLGRVPRDRLPAEYAAAGVLAITSRHEAQSMVAVEAAACGVPVVGTGVGVVPELAVAGGAIVAQGEPAAFAAALDAALAPATGARLGAAARACAVHAWDMRWAAVRLSSVWRDLARKPDAR